VFPVRLVPDYCTPHERRKSFSNDNALADSVIGLYTTEVIGPQGPWRHAQQVEFATLTWIDWFNNRRLLEPLGHVPRWSY
jgi:transposase InsO family protein